MRLFRSLFPWFRRPPADPTPTPDAGSPVWYAYTPQAKARDAHMQARIILEHLMCGHTASRRQMMRTGMSDQGWSRGVWMLKAAGVISAPRPGASLELVIRDWEYAEELLDRAYARLLDNVRKPRYTMPFR